MVKLNSQKTIQNIENNFLKKDLPILKIGDNARMELMGIEPTSI